MYIYIYICISISISLSLSLFSLSLYIHIYTYIAWYHTAARHGPVRAGAHGMPPVAHGPPGRLPRRG